MKSRLGDFGESGERVSLVVVVAADEPLLRREIVESLAPAIAVVESAGNARGAKDTLQHHGPAALILVLDPPLRDCRAEEACAASIAHHPNTRTLVLVRANRFDHVNVACREGARGVLPTDVHPRVLQRVVARIAAGETVIHPPFSDRLMSGLPGERNVEALTGTEICALTLVSDGRTSKRVAVELRTTPSAVDHSIERAAQRLGATHRAHAVADDALQQPEGDFHRRVGGTDQVVVATPEKRHLDRHSRGPRRHIGMAGMRTALDAWAESNQTSARSVRSPGGGERPCGSWLDDSRWSAVSVTTVPPTRRSLRFLRRIGGPESMPYMLGFPK